MVGRETWNINIQVTQNVERSIIKLMQSGTKCWYKIGHIGLRMSIYIWGGKHSWLLNSKWPKVLFNQTCLLYEPNFYFLCVSLTISIQSGSVCMSIIWLEHLEIWEMTKFLSQGHSDKLPYWESYQGIVTFRLHKPPAV